jgi:type II secretory pathway pseudopilin PulG
MVKQRVGESGFTIVEVLLSLFVLSTVLTIGFQIVTLGNQMSTRAKVTLAANAIAFAKVQEYENKTFTNINTGVSGNNYEIEDFSSAVVTDSNGAIDSATAKVYVQPISGSLRKLSVKVTYKVLSETKFIEYATYIQLGGVGR